MSYKDKNKESYYLVKGGLRWEVTDNYGWPISKSETRDVIISEVLSSISDKKLEYNISIKKNDEEGWGQYTALFNGKKLKIYSLADDDSTSHLRVNFNCSSFEEAEKLINLVMDGNNMELYPVSKSSFKTRR